MDSLQSHRQDSGSTVAKKVLHALENNTKGYFQESIPGKVRFQKIWGPWPPPTPSYPTRLCWGVCETRYLPILKKWNINFLID